LKYCNDCKQKFENPKELKQPHCEIDDDFEETFLVCPHCGSFDWEMMKHCLMCCQYVPSKDDYCEEHKELIIDLMAVVMAAVYKDSFADRKKTVALIEWWIGEETK